VEDCSGKEKNRKRNISAAIRKRGGGKDRRKWTGKADGNGRAYFLIEKRGGADYLKKAKMNEVKGEKGIIKRKVGVKMGNRG